MVYERPFTHEDPRGSSPNEGADFRRGGELEHWRVSFVDGHEHYELLTPTIRINEPDLG